MALLTGYKRKNKFHMEKGQSYIILSNHQRDIDGLLMGLSFNRPYCGLTTDTFFSKGLIAKIWRHMFAIIPKKKGSVDVKSTFEMMTCIKEHGSLTIYPEGNRTYAEFQFPFTPGFAKFLKHFQVPVVVFNMHGGTGVKPRFAGKGRKGKFYGEVKKVFSPEEYNKLSDEEFEKALKDNLRVFDSESGDLYKSKRKAEYLERMFFVCPMCGEIETLSSEGNHFRCSKCGLDVEFNENLTFSSEDEAFKFKKLVDWYNYQIRFIKNFEVTDKIIFKDDNVKLFISNPGQKRILLSKGKVELYKDKIVFGSNVINVKDIIIASPISGTNMGLTTSEQNYLVVGHERFNPLKYVLMLNRLDCPFAKDEGNIYYNLEEKH